MVTGTFKMFWVYSLSLYQTYEELSNYNFDYFSTFLENLKLPSCMHTWCLCLCFLFSLTGSFYFSFEYSNVWKKCTFGSNLLKLCKGIRRKIKFCAVLISDITSNKYITSNQIFAKCFFWLLMFCFLIYLDMSVLLMLSNLATTNSAFAYKIFLASLACKNQHSGRFLSLLCRFMQNAFCWQGKAWMPLNVITLNC